VFHNGLVKRPSSVPELEQLGPTKKVGGRTILTGLVDNPLDVPASGMNKHFKAWRKALEGWRPARWTLARGCRPLEIPKGFVGKR
jgi:hypothetical protein